MQKALEIARQSGSDLPVGAVVVKDGKIIAACHNQQEQLNDVSAHAEILAIREASKILGNWRLNDCEMYVTLEPCPMCAWAILRSRISSLYFGSYDMIYGGFSVLKELKQLSSSSISVKGGIMEKECDELIKKYFEEIR